MSTGLVGSDMAKITQRQFTEGAAGTGEDDAGNPVIFQRGIAQLLLNTLRQALEDSVMFAIDRQKLAATLTDGIHENTTTGDQGLFVSKQDLFTSTDGGQRR